ncbi:MAG: dihydrofolate reductase [Chlorobiaceae bacterium]|nr:dihydrofolate reductase [Chlorobiaceae bacterium]
MRKLSVFNFISLDGCFDGAVRGDIGWHPHDIESSGYAAEMLARHNTLLFGRVTYDMMAGYWSSEEAKRNDPKVADGMNRAEKIVFSRSMQSAAWSNTTVLNEDIADQVRRMKGSEGNDMTILGSGSIVTQFASQDLVDEYQIMIDPVVVGNGRKIFEGIEKTIRLQLIGTNVFRNGSVILSYRRVE